LAPTLATTPPYSSYKYPHSLHSENHIRVHGFRFQVLPLQYFVE
jgi:hypothetical protein